MILIGTNLKIDVREPFVFIWRMKYVALFLVLIIAGLAYIRFEQPQMWNDYLSQIDEALKAPEGPAGAGTASNQAPPPPAPGPPTNVYISPDSTNYLNPDHIRPVQQPGENPAPTNAPATNMPATNAPSTIAPSTNAVNGESPTTIPSTIVTISGKTYTDCVLSRATPDGISFMHSLGVAKVPFSDLDPALAAKFGYDPAAAQKYEQQEAVQEQASDAQRAAAESYSATNASESDAAAVAPAASAPPPSSLSPGQRQAIQQQIASLQSDIAFMQGEENKLLGPQKNILSTDYGQVSQGGYAGKIAAEQAQVAQLNQQLSR
jgi:hypothetical protein